MDILTIIIIGLFGLLTMGIVAMIMIARSSYKHPVMVAVQTGQNIDDVTLVPDRCRVRQTEDGYYILQFKTLKNDRMPSPEFSLWQKFMRGGKAFDPQESLEQASHKNKFSEKEMKGILSRGLLLYKTSEGELKPCIFTATGKLTVLNQDNRAFLIHEAERRAKLNRTKLDRWVPVVTTLGIVLIMGLIFAFYMVYLNTNLADNIGAICSGVSSNSPSINQTIANILPGA